MIILFFNLFFHDFLLFHLLLSTLFFASLFSPSPLSSLVLSLLFSCLLLLSLLLSPSPLFFFFAFSFSLFRLLFSLSVFFLCLLSPCVGGVCVSSCVSSCVSGVVWCGVCRVVWCGTLKTLCVDSKTPPCVDSKRPCVCRQHAHMLLKMCACCRHTRGRFESTHGGVFESTHGWSSPVQFTKKITHVEFSLGHREVHHGNPQILHNFSLRKDREQHVPDSSHHSLCLMKLLSSSYPGETLEEPAVRWSDLSFADFRILDLYRLSKTSSDEFLT